MEKTPEPKYTPIAASSSHFSFHESEKLIIDKLREWSYDYFRSTYLYDAETRVNE